jgi:glucokinase
LEHLKLSVGIDIGGTNTKLGLVDTNGNLIKRVNFSTNPLLNFLDYQALLTNAIEEVTQGISKSDLLGVGLGVPGANGNTGSIPEAANIPFLSEVPLKNVLERAMELTCFCRKRCKCSGFR